MAKSKEDKMPTDQIKLLSSLAKEIKTEKKDREKVVAFLQSAKILTKHENFTGNYSNLQRIVSASK